MKKTLVVLTGAGISAESGVKTFRDHNGLWENHDIMEVASIEGWHKNPEVVLDFYNARRKQLEEVTPNAAHLGLVDLEEFFNVHVITQNVDNLHERAGSKNIVHLHGELTQVKEWGSEDVIDIGYSNIQKGDLGPSGKQLRPNIVWFGEDVPMMSKAIEIASKADVFVVIGTSMTVYPAASLIDYVPAHARKYVINPEVNPLPGTTSFNTTATEGVARLKHELLDN